MRIGILGAEIDAQTGWLRYQKRQRSSLHSEFGFTCIQKTALTKLNCYKQVPLMESFYVLMLASLICLLHTGFMSCFAQIPIHKILLKVARSRKKRAKLQGDHSACGEPPVDFRTKFLVWPGQARPGQAKAELLFRSQRKVRHKLNGHPVHVCKNSAAALKRGICPDISGSMQCEHVTFHFQPVNFGFDRDFDSA